MARVKLGPFFFLFFFLAGTLQAAPAEKAQAPEAYASADGEHLYLWINQSDLAATGAWMAFFDLGLGKGAKTKEGGLESIDLRYEQGRLFRHTPGFETNWTPAGSPLPMKWESWQVLRIPIPHMVPHGTVIKWRVALFPHSQKKPLFLPEHHLGKIDSGRRLEFSPSRENPFHLFLSLVKGQKELSLPKESFSFPEEPVPSPLELQELWPGELVISLNEGSKEDIERQMNVAFTHLQMKAFPLIVDPGKNELPMGDFMSAIQLACAFSKRPFAPVVRSISDLPAHPTTLIMPWDGPLKERVVLLERIRTDFPEVRLFIHVAKSFFNLKGDERELALRSWHRFKARPLLSRGIDLSSTRAKHWLPFLWQNFLMESNLGWREMPSPLPPPPGKVSISPQRRIENHWKYWYDSFGQKEE